MKIEINKKLLNFIINFITIFGIELIFKLVRNSYLLNYAMLRIILSSLILSFVISQIVSLFKNKVEMIINLCICLILSVYAWLQLGFYRYVGTYMSLNGSSQASKVTEFIWDFLISISGEFYLLYIPLGLLLIYYFLIPLILKKKNLIIVLKNDKTPRREWLKKVIKVFATLFACYLYFLTLVSPFMQSKYQFEKNLDLFIVPNNQSVAINQFGVNVFLLLDINNYIFDFEYSQEEVPNIKPNKPIITDNSRKIDDTNWKIVMENETKNVYKNINNYLMNQRITPKNEYTGMFKDKNVIFIMMESIGMLGINEEYFPTLYKLWNEGISFTNFYSPRNSCPTGNNEMTAMTGLFSIADSCTANAYRKTNYPQAVFYKFREQGYYASSYHNYIDYFYYRKDIHKQCGSEAYYNATALGIKGAKDREWPSDLELFQNGLPHFINEEKFVTYFTTVTTHAPYDYSSEFGDKHLDLFSDLDQPMSIKRYYSKLYEFDLALKYLLDELTAQNKLDDTVIVLFGDHQPYALGQKKQVDILGEEFGINKNLEKTPLIIYNPNIEAKQIVKYASIVDILPTILNLFDIDHDPRLYFGTDVFDKGVAHRAIFADGSWQDEVGFYNSSNDTFIPNDPEDIENHYTDEEVLEINTSVNLKLKISTAVIRNNYFDYLFKKINELN